MERQNRSTPQHSLETGMAPDQIITDTISDIATSYPAMLIATPRLLEKQRFTPTPLDPDVVAKYLKERDALTDDIIHSLSPAVAKHMDLMLDTIDGDRSARVHEHFSIRNLIDIPDLPQDVRADLTSFENNPQLSCGYGEGLKLRNRALASVIGETAVYGLLNGTATVPQRLHTLEKTQAQAIEIGRFTMPYGYGHHLLPEMHREMREGILTYDPEASLHAPIIEKLQFRAAARKNDNDVPAHQLPVDAEPVALTAYARLNHGTLSDGSVVRAKEIFTIPLNGGSVLKETPSTEKVNYVELSTYLQHTILEHVLNPDKDDDEPEAEFDKKLFEDSALGALIADYYANEYHEHALPGMPDDGWLIPLSSTFYVAHPERVQQVKDRARQHDAPVNPKTGLTRLAEVSEMAQKHAEEVRKEKAQRHALANAKLT